MMRIFVTGATGFIGSFLVEALLDKGYDVRCLVRTTSNLRWISDLDVECFYGSLLDPSSLKEGLKDVDYVYHVAGITKAGTEKAFYDGNFEATRHLVHAVLDAGMELKRFLHVSSLAAAGPSPTIRAITEDHPPAPLTYYGKSKLAAEAFLKEYFDKLPVTIVRPPAVYGPRDTDILDFFKTVKMGIIPQLQGKDKYASLIFVRDLVAGMIQAAEKSKARSQIYYLSDPKPYSYEEFARVILNAMGKRGIRLPVPLPMMKGIAALSEGFARLTKKNTIINKQKMIEMEQDFWVCSPVKAKKEFGFESRYALVDGVEETLRWYVQNKWL